MMRNTVLALMSAVLLSACATQPKTAEEFWFGQGERFGSNGYQLENSHLDRIKEKVPFEQQAYIDGYKKGKLSYCDPNHAFEKGIQGKRYEGQCDDFPDPVRVRAEWQRGWDAFIGMDFYRHR